MLYSIIDIETTGGNYKQGKIIEIAIFVYDGKNIIDDFCSLVNPEIPLPPYITQLTGINNQMLADAPVFADIAKRIVEITTKTVIVAHNIQFDYGFLREELRRCDKKFERHRLCTQKLAQKIFPGMQAYGLGKICEVLSIPMQHQHRAVEDAKATTLLFDKMLQLDNGAYINAMLNQKDQEHWPPNLSIEKVQNLPENAGLYFLKNKANEVVFIDRSNDIQDRVFQHFAEFPKSEWRKEMFNEVCDIDFELTGSELLAMILENYAIKKHRPIYNQRKRTIKYHWAIIHYKNEQGYICFKVNNVKQRNLALSYHRTEAKAKEFLTQKMELFDLNARLCQLETKKSAKINPQNTPVELYNTKALKAIKSFEYEIKDFLIICEGRHETELVGILVRDERFVGYNFFEKEILDYPDEAAKLIPPILPNFEADLIIKSYIRNEHLVKIVPLLLLE